jgi:hypothetical protein
MEPVSLGDMARYEGGLLPDGVRESWLRRIRAAGSERGAAIATFSPVAVSVGRFGVQLSSVAAGSLALNGDAAELVLYGNAGNDGGRIFDLDGSRADGWVVSTLAVAYGLPVGPVLGGRLALGATGKVSVGHALLVGRDVGSTVDGADPDVRLDFPVLTVAPGSGFFASSPGLGLDLGAQWMKEDLALGLAVRNVVNTFGWELADLSFRPGTALFEGGEDFGSDFDPRPAGEAPGVLRRAALDLGFGPTVEIGLAVPLRSATDLVASFERTFGPDFGVVARQRVGLGVQTRTLDRVPLGFHASVVERSLRVGGGATVAFGGFRVSGAGSATVGETDREGWIGAFSVSWQPEPGKEP